jgi:hydroxymethylpyrimidine pyrophosphatase-like HAD family hydrolase
MKKPDIKLVALDMDGTLQILQEKPKKIGERLKAENQRVLLY